MISGLISKDPFRRVSNTNPCKNFVFGYKAPSLSYLYSNCLKSGSIGFYPKDHIASFFSHPVPLTPPKKPLDTWICTDHTGVIDRLQLGNMAAVDHRVNYG